MKRFLRAGLALALAVGASGCVDLNEKLVSSLGASYAKTAQGLTDATNGIYAGAKGYLGGDGLYAMEQMGVDTWTAADQVTAGGAQNWIYLDTYANTYNTLAAYVNNEWGNGYGVIARANVVLDNGPNVPVGATLTQAIKDSRLGEAHFLRAWAYFNLVQQFGDLTINLHQPQGTLTTEATRQSQDSVYKVIIDDLNQAITQLPVTQPDVGRITKGAAQSLLSKVYLTRAYASWNTANKQADFQKALDQANAVISSGTYSLLPVYADLWCGTHRAAVPADPGRQSFCDLTNYVENNKEVIWAIQYSYDPVQWTNTGANYNHVVFLSQYDGGAGGWANGMTRDVDNGRPFRRIRPTPYTISIYNQTRYANGQGALGADVLDTRFDGSYQTVWFANGNSADTVAKTAPGYPTGVCPKCTSGAMFHGSMLGSGVNQGPAAGSDTALVYLGYQVTDAYRLSKSYRIGTPCTTDPDADCGMDNDAKGMYGYGHYPSLKKFQDNLRNGLAPGSGGPVADQNGGKDRIVIRLGELYLLKAEAALGLAQNQVAADAINVLRNRAACDPSTNVKLCATSHKNDPLLQVSAGQVTLDLIYDERERELGGEMSRWDDLHRPGKDFFLARIKAHNPYARPNIGDKHYFRPIPAQQIQGVTGTPYPQNPGW